MTGRPRVHLELEFEHQNVCTIVHGYVVEHIRVEVNQITYWSERQVFSFITGRIIIA